MAAVSSLQIASTNYDIYSTSSKSAYAITNTAIKVASATSASTAAYATSAGAAPVASHQFSSHTNFSTYFNGTSANSALTSKSALSAGSAAKAASATSALTAGNADKIYHSVWDADSFSPIVFTTSTEGYTTVGHDNNFAYKPSSGQLNVIKIKTNEIDVFNGGYGTVSAGHFVGTDVSANNFYGGIFSGNLSGSAASALTAKSALSAGTSTGVKWEVGTSDTARPLAFANASQKTNWEAGNVFYDDMTYDKDLLYNPSSNVLWNSGEGSYIQGKSNAFTAGANKCSYAILDGMSNTATQSSFTRGDLTFTTRPTSGVTIIGSNNLCMGLKNGAMIGDHLTVRCVTTGTHHLNNCLILGSYNSLFNIDNYDNTKFIIGEPVIEGSTTSRTDTFAIKGGGTIYDRFLERRVNYFGSIAGNQYNPQSNYEFIVNPYSTDPAKSGYLNTLYPRDGSYLVASLEGIVRPTDIRIEKASNYTFGTNTWDKMYLTELVVGHETEGKATVGLNSPGYLTVGENSPGHLLVSKNCSLANIEIGCTVHNSGATYYYDNSDNGVYHINDGTYTDTTTSTAGTTYMYIGNAYTKLQISDTRNSTTAVAQITIADSGYAELCLAHSNGNSSNTGHLAKVYIGSEGNFIKACTTNYNLTAMSQLYVYGGSYAHWFNAFNYGEGKEGGFAGYYGNFTSCSVLTASARSVTALTATGNSAKYDKISATSITGNLTGTATNAKTASYIDVTLDNTTTYPVELKYQSTNAGAAAKLNAAGVSADYDNPGGSWTGYATWTNIIKAADWINNNTTGNSAKTAQNADNSDKAWKVYQEVWTANEHRPIRFSYNSAGYGSLGYDSSFTFNPSSDLLKVPNISATNITGTLVGIAAGALTAANVKWTKGTDDVARPISFANSNVSASFTAGNEFNSSNVYDTGFVFNPSTKILTLPGSIQISAKGLAGYSNNSGVCSFVNNICDWYGQSTYSTGDGINTSIKKGLSNVFLTANAAQSASLNVKDLTAYNAGAKINFYATCQSGISKSIIFENFDGAWTAAIKDNTVATGNGSNFRIMYNATACGNTAAQGQIITRTTASNVSFFIYKTSDGYHVWAG